MKIHLTHIDPNEYVVCVDQGKQNQRIEDIVVVIITATILRPGVRIYRW